MSDSTEASESLKIIDSLESSTDETLDLGSNSDTRSTSSSKDTSEEDSLYSDELSNDDFESSPLSESFSHKETVVMNSFDELKRQVISRVEQNACHEMKNTKEQPSELPGTSETHCEESEDLFSKAKNLVLFSQNKHPGIFSGQIREETFWDNDYIQPSRYVKPRSSVSSRQEFKNMNLDKILSISKHIFNRMRDKSKKESSRKEVFLFSKNEDSIKEKKISEVNDGGKMTTSCFSVVDDGTVTSCIEGKDASKEKPVLKRHGSNVEDTSLFPSLNEDGTVGKKRKPTLNKNTNSLSKTARRAREKRKKVSPTETHSKAKRQRKRLRYLTSNISKLVSNESQYRIVGFHEPETASRSLRKRTIARSLDHELDGFEALSVSVEHISQSKGTEIFDKDSPWKQQEEDREGISSKKRFIDHSFFCQSQLGTGVMRVPEEIPSTSEGKVHLLGVVKEGNYSKSDSCTLLKSLSNEKSSLNSIRNDLLHTFVSRTCNSSEPSDSLEEKMESESEQILTEEHSFGYRRGESKIGVLKSSNSGNCSNSSMPVLIPYGKASRSKTELSVENEISHSSEAAQSMYTPFNTSCNDKGSLDQTSTPKRSDRSAAFELNTDSSQTGNMDSDQDKHFDVTFDQVKRKIISKWLETHDSEFPVCCLKSVSLNVESQHFSDDSKKISPERTVSDRCPTSHAIEQNDLLDCESKSKKEMVMKYEQKNSVSSSSTISTGNPEKNKDSGMFDSNEKEIWNLLPQNLRSILFVDEFLKRIRIENYSDRYEELPIEEISFFLPRRPPSAENLFRRYGEPPSAENLFRRYGEPPSAENLFRRYREPPSEENVFPWYRENLNAITRDFNVLATERRILKLLRRYNRQCNRVRFDNLRFDESRNGNSSDIMVHDRRLRRTVFSNILAIIKESISTVVNEIDTRYSERNVVDHLSHFHLSANLSDFNFTKDAMSILYATGIKELTTFQRYVLGVVLRTDHSRILAIYSKPFDKIVIFLLAALKVIDVGDDCVQMIIVCPCEKQMQSLYDDIQRISQYWQSITVRLIGINDPVIKNDLNDHVVICIPYALRKNKFDFGRVRMFLIDDIHDIRMRMDTNIWSPVVSELPKETILILFKHDPCFRGDPDAMDVFPNAWSLRLFEPLKLLVYDILCDTSDSQIVFLLCLRLLLKKSGMKMVVLISPDQVQSFSRIMARFAYIFTKTQDDHIRRKIRRFVCSTKRNILITTTPLLTPFLDHVHAVVVYHYFKECDFSDYSNRVVNIYRTIEGPGMVINVFENSHQQMQWRKKFTYF